MRESLLSALVLFSILKLTAQSPTPLKNSYQTFTTGNVGQLQYAANARDGLLVNGDELEATTGYFSSIMMTSVDPNGWVRSAAVKDDVSSSDFAKGVLDNYGDLVIEGSDKICDQVWVFKDDQILRLIELHREGLLKREDLDPQFFSYPAYGNFEYPDEFYRMTKASYYDRVHDGIYDPLDGDYPIPTGLQDNVIPSVYSFRTFNTVGDQSFSGGEFSTMKMQVNVEQYMVACGGSDMSSTVFNNIRTTSMDTDYYEDFKFGVFIHELVGCAEGDFLGVDVETNTVYFYNDLGSELCNYDDMSVRAEENQIIAYQFEDEIYSVVPFDESIDVMRSPSSIAEVHNALNGMFVDGDSMTYGGTAYDSSSSDYVLIPFTDFPNEPSGWSQQWASFSSLDRRAKCLVSFDNGLYTAGEIKSHNYTRTVLTWNQVGFIEAFNQFRERLSKLNQDFLDYKKIEPTNPCPELEYCETDCVWPGDIDQNGRVEGKDLLYLHSASGQTGSSRQRIDSGWFPHNSEDWSTEVQEIDLKYYDVNGNGVINSFDCEIVADRLYGKRNANYDESNVQSITEGRLQLTHNNGEYYWPDAYDGTRMSVVTALKGVEADIPLSGLAYSISCDPAFISTSNLSTQVDHPSFDVDHAFYRLTNGRTVRSDRDYMEDVVAVECVHLSNDSAGVVQASNLDVLSFAIRDDITTRNVDGRDTTYLRFTEIIAMDRYGEPYNLGAESVSLPIIINNMEVNTTVSIDESQDKGCFSVYPNPSDGDILYLSESLEEIRIFGSGANKVLHKTAPELQLDISELMPGLYIIQGLNNERVIVSSKFVKV